ncbi:MAG: hypothetical protein OIN87_10540 [Candidatus Methanoperedens sp.]|nr:hypothetical protein [Candidatus Methanoperedens sp.]
MSLKENGVNQQSVLDEAMIFSKKMEYSNERAKDIDTQQIINDFGKYKFYFHLTMKPEFRRFATIRNYTKHNCWRFFFYSQKYSVTNGFTTVSPSQYRALSNISPNPPINFSNGKKDFIIKDGIDQTCIICRGKKYINCEYCSGRKIITCSDCNGNKYIFENPNTPEKVPPNNKEMNTMNPVKCKTCNGKGNVKCSKCGGTGEKRCDFCEGSGVTFSVDKHRMKYFVDPQIQTLYGDIPKNRGDKFRGKKEIERNFIDPNPPFQEGISACRIEGFSIPILLLDVYFEGREYKIYYDLHNKKFQWNGYPVDHMRIMVSSSIFILSLFVIIYFLTNGRII